MDFISDYWAYNSCYEIPRNYSFWTAIGLIGATIHRKVVFMHGDIDIHGNVYIGLIGPQGIAKSTTNNFARSFFMGACPDLKIGPSRSSPEAIIKLMNEKDFARAFTDWNGESQEVRPLAFFINEFKNFVGRGPIDMINMLTDIYDVKAYDASSIVRGAEFVVHPSVNIILCETDDWIRRNLKGDTISGGFFRRLIPVFELEEPPPKPEIIITPEVAAAKLRIQQRLIDIRKQTGEFKWESTSTHELFKKWYNDTWARRQKETNGMMRGYLKSKHIQIFKTMMALDSVSDKPMFTFSKENLDFALAHMDVLEKNIPRLSIAGGRNETMEGQMKILELLEASDGMLPEKQLRRTIEGEFKNTMELLSVLKNLEDTDRVEKRNLALPNVEGTLVPRWYILTKARWNKGVKSGEFKLPTQEKKQ